MNGVENLEDYVLRNPYGNIEFGGLEGHHLNINGIVYTERNFYNALMYRISKVFPDNDNYLNNHLSLMTNLHANFTVAIKQNLIDNNGNIIYDNSNQYVSLRNEITRLKVNLNYAYK
jgi:hypothetical protein